YALDFALMGQMEERLRRRRGPTWWKPQVQSSLRRTFGVAHGAGAQRIRGWGATGRQYAHSRRNGNTDGRRHREQTPLLAREAIHVLRLRRLGDRNLDALETVGEVRGDLRRSVRHAQELRRLNSIDGIANLRCARPIRA